MKSSKTAKQIRRDNSSRSNREGSVTTKKSASLVKKSSLTLKGAKMNASRTMHQSQVTNNRESVTSRIPRPHLEDEVFYHGLLPRADVNLLLTEPGDFMVRTTQKHEGRPKELAISVMWNGRVRHIVPEKTSRGTICIDRFEFENITDLVRYHLKNKQPLKLGCPWQLIYPVPKQDWELKKTQVQLETKLGAGASGEVFRGILILGDGATKTVAANLTEFMNEARLMRQYDHRNVVAFYGVVTEEPVMIVMEFVPGGRLDSHLQKKPPNMSVAQLISYCLDAAKGLEYLHGKNCMHRDVAARNCLIGKSVVKISDFGLCREEGHYKMNPQKRVPIRWLAPETLSTAVYTFKSDVFSYGVLMWEIFSDGQEPYPGLRAIDVQQRVRNGYRMDPPRRMPKDMKDILLACWEQKQARRPEFSVVVQMLTETARGIGYDPPESSKASKLE